MEDQMHDVLHTASTGELRAEKGPGIDGICIGGKFRDVVHQEQLFDT
jgi:hypothetical protein